MIIASLAWTLKAWFALMLPVSPRWQKQHEQQRGELLRMEFRTFLQQLMLVPTQVLNTGRRIVLRVLSWRPELDALFRLADSL